MLKIRLQGTVKDIRWFKRLLESHPEIRVLSVSEIFSNKGTNRYFRSYAEVEKTEKKDWKRRKRNAKKKIKNLIPNKKSKQN